MEEIKNRIDEILKEHARYNAAKLAEMIGMKQTTVTNYVKGNRKPSLEFVIKILENLPVNPEWLWYHPATIRNNRAQHLPIFHGFQLQSRRGHS